MTHCVSTPAGVKPSRPDVSSLKDFNINQVDGQSDVIGRSLFGVVYRWTFPETGVAYAVKVVDSSKGKHEENDESRGGVL